MPGFVKLQSPDIATSLRNELALSGAGSFSMDLDTTVQPVAIVADTRPGRVEEHRAYVGGVYRGAGGAATYNRFQLIWALTPPAPIVRVEIMRIQFSVINAQTVYYGWATPQPVGTSRTIQGKEQQATGITIGRACELYDDNSGVAPVSSEYAGRVVLPANNTVVLDFSADPWVLRQPGTGAAPGFNITQATANAELHMVVEWREYLR